VVDSVVEAKEKPARGKSRGTNFFVLDPALWARLCKLPTANRLNLLLTFLVLLAGTGRDHRVTSWSAKACEDNLGVGKPRAKRAIEELIAHGVVERTEEATPMLPQYRLPLLPREIEPIYLPTQIITGLGRETPILRRIRETGDAALLCMLIDLYGAVQIDATHGVRLDLLAMHAKQQPRKVAETGVHTIWALSVPDQRRTNTADWARNYADGGDWDVFWERASQLQRLGAIWYESWVFDSAVDDAEPLMPLDFGKLYSSVGTDATADLMAAMEAATAAIIGDRDYLFDKFGEDVLVPLPSHHQPPAIRSVIRMRVEPDTPGRRLAYGKRMRLVEGRATAYRQVAEDVAAGHFDRPMNLREHEQNWDRAQDQASGDA
jgi:hypothetical protein